LWRGLFYDATARRDASDILPKLTYDEHLALHAAAQREGLRAATGKVRLLEAARSMVAIAHQGLKRLDPADAPLLEPLQEQLVGGRSPAEDLLEAWNAHQDPVALISRSSL
jgi:glutamate--cysteine ligase